MTGYHKRVFIVVSKILKLIYHQKYRMRKYYSNLRKTRKVRKGKIGDEYVVAHNGKEISLQARNRDIESFEESLDTEKEKEREGKNQTKWFEEN